MKNDCKTRLLKSGVCPYFLIVFTLLFIQVLYANNVPKVTAHRGFSSAAPENTLAAFEKAIEVGADYFELDVYTSLDGVLVVMHDSTVDRTTDGTGNVADFTLAQLKALDAGSWFNMRFTGERIPTFEEALKLAKGRIKVMIEIKSADASAVCNLVDSLGMRDEVVIASFDLAKVTQAHNLGFKTLGLISDIKSWQSVQTAGGDIVGPGYSSMDDDSFTYVSQAQNVGLEVWPWTCDNEMVMMRLTDLRVNGIITNYPDWLKNIQASIKNTGWWVRWQVEDKPRDAGAGNSVESNRIIIKPKGCNILGTRIRIKIRSRTSIASSIAYFNFYIALSDTNTRDIIDGTKTPITFNGTNTVTLSQSSYAWSDWVTYNFNSANTHSLTWAFSPGYPRAWNGTEINACWTIGDSTSINDWSSLPGVNSSNSVFTLELIEVDGTREGVSYFTADNTSTSANGSSSSNVTFTIKDSTGGALNNKAVTFTTDRASRDVLTQPGLTDSNGQCTGTISSSYAGASTLYGFCEGKEIKNNLLSNASFENGLTGWTIAANHYLDTGTVHTGYGSLRFTGTAAADQFSYQDVTVSGSTSYRISAWIKSNLSTGKAYLDWQEYTAGDSLVLDGYNIGPYSASSNVWSYCIWKFTTQGNTAKVRVRFVTDSTPTGSAWFDDVCIERVPAINFTATKLKIATTPFGIFEYASSPEIRIEARGNSGEDTDITFNETVSLTTSSSSGCFSVNSASWVNTTVIYLCNGIGVVYYKDGNTGTSIITVSRTGLTFDTQTEQILEAPPDETSSYIIFNPLEIPANGTSNCSVTVTLRKHYGAPVAGKMITLTTSRGTSYTVVENNYQVSDVNGQCTFSIKSAYAGSDTVTATSEGKTISAGIDKLGAVGLWYLDGNVSDASGYSNNGTVYGALWSKGKFGSCLYFDGANDRVEIPDSDILDISEALTIEAWVNPDTYPNAGNNILAKYYSASNQRAYLLQIRAGEDKLRAWMSTDGSGSFSYLGSGIVPVGTWTHVACTWNKSDAKARFYINGNFDNEIAATDQSLFKGTAKFIIGDKQDLNEPFKGYIDEVRVRNRALSNNEVKASYYSRTNPRFVPTRLYITTPVRSIVTNETSAGISIEAQGNSGGKDDMFNETITLTSSSTTGRFSLDKMNWSTASDSIVSLSGGSVIIYYKDSTLGSPVITVSRQGLELDTQIVKVRTEILRPLTPVGLRANILGSHIMLDWKSVTKNTDGSACEDLDKYFIYRSQSTGGPYVKTGETSSTQTFSVDYNAAGDTPYYYVVSAVNTQGDSSSYSQEVDNKTNISVRGADAWQAGDTLTYLYIPKESAGILYKETNGLDYDIRIEITNVAQGFSPALVKAYDFVPYKGDTNEVAQTFRFASPVTLSLHYDVDTLTNYIKGTTIPASQARDRLGLFWWNSLEWIKLGANIDMNSQTLSIQTGHLSRYAVFTTTNATRLTLTKRIPSIITPNGDGINDVCFFYYENPNNRDITGRIYDLSGSMIVDRLSNGSVSNSMKWDGKDDYGNTVESGIYIYQLQGGDELISGTIVVAK